MGRYTGQTCRLIFMLVLTASFFVAELVSGYVGNSIALISDSFNMLSDLIALCVGIATGRIARRRGRRGPAATFGYGRAEVVGALSNAVFLAALCFTILVEAVQRLAQPEGIRDPFLILVVGALGLAVNLVGLLIFQDWGWCCKPMKTKAKAPAPGLDGGQPQAAAASFALEESAGSAGDLDPGRVCEVVAEAPNGDEAGAPRMPPRLSPPLALSRLVSSLFFPKSTFPFRPPSLSLL